MPLPEVTTYKLQVTIPVSHALLNDIGGNYPEAPLSPEFLRWYRREKRRQAIADRLVSPLWWLGRAGEGATWLGVELTNVLYRIFRVNARMVHDSAEDEDEDD